MLTTNPNTTRQGSTHGHSVYKDKCGQEPRAQLLPLALFAMLQSPQRIKRNTFSFKADVIQPLNQNAPKAHYVLRRFQS